MDFGFYIRIFLRRLPYFLTFVALGTAAGLSLAIMLPPVFEARATLIVESEQIPDELAASTVRTEATEQLQIIQQRILTRETLLEMANRLDVYDTPGDARMSADEKVEDMRRRISMRITGGASTRGPDQAVIVKVGFEASAAALAAQVANEIVTLILRENIEMRTTVAGQTLDFFTREVERLDQELQQISGRLLEFQEENIDALPDSLEFRRSQQAALQERLSQLSREEDALSTRRTRLVEMAQAGTLPEAQIDRKNMTPEAAQLEELRNQYANSVAVLSLDNPKVAVLRSRIDNLEQIVANQAAQQSGAPTTLNGSPLSALDVQLADIDTQLGYMADQRIAIQAQMDNLARTINATPGNAITLETLQRNYDNVRLQYNQAVANRARAETGDVIESLSKGQRISVVEQAVAPREPTSPNRPMLAAAGVGGGVALGFGIVLLLELLNTAVRRPVEISDKLGIAAFATVPYIRTRAEVRRKRVLMAGTVAAICIGVPAALWLIDTQVMPLDPLIGRILSQLNLAAVPGSAGPLAA